MPSDGEILNPSENQEHDDLLSGEDEIFGEESVLDDVDPTVVESSPLDDESSVEASVVSESVDVETPGEVAEASTVNDMEHAALDAVFEVSADHPETIAESIEDASSGDDPEVLEAEAVEPELLEPEVLSAEPEPEVAMVPEADLEAVKIQLAQAQADLEVSQKETRQMKNRALRGAADLENFRRRTQKEKVESEKYAVEGVVKDLLEVVDNLERALKHQASKATEDDTEVVKGLVSGVDMVLKQFQQKLTKYGVEGFDSLHLPFDPLKHEALQQVESTEFPTGTVMNVFQRGYFLHERLLRPAMVVVSHNPQEMETSADQESEEEAEEGSMAEVVAEEASPEDTVEASEEAAEESEEAAETAQ